MDATVTWLGHATALISFGDTRLLIDPLGRRRCRSLPHYQAVLITHAHVDHLNRWTLSQLDRSAQLIVPTGAQRYVSDLKFSSITEVEPGDHISIGGLDVCAVPTKHDSGRWKKGDSPLCAGYVIRKGEIAVHHAGDIDMSDFAVFEDIAREHAIDTTLLPIGGMLPVWYYRWRRKSLDRGVHIDPDTALEVAKLLQVKRMVPVHWGTVHLRLGPPSAPKHRLTKIAHEAGDSDLVHVLGHGEALTIKT